MAIRPYDQRATIKNAGEVLATDVPCHFERVGQQSETARGERYDWEGQVDITAKAHLLRVGARQMILDGKEYRVVDSQEFDLLPHLVVQIAEIRAGG